MSRTTTCKKYFTTSGKPANKKQCYKTGPWAGFYFMDKLPDKLILFDGVCNLCNRSVQFVIRHDPDARFHFASLQSSTGQAVCTRFGMADQQLDSFVLIDRGKAYTQSSAALRVSKYLSGGWKLLYTFLIVPPFIRDAVYRWIARNRYRWFGKREACMIPSPELRHRFLD